MRNYKDSPERRREKMRQEELKGNQAGNMKDASHRAQSGSLVDLVNGLGWKGLGILILLVIIGYFIASLFLN